MRENQASQTAEFMALFRALEDARPRHVRLFADPFARVFLRPSLRTIVSLSRVPFFNTAVCRFIDRHWPGARSSGVARTRFIDDMVMKALRDDAMEQIVFLGAGFDSRAYRLPGIERTRVFEVDYPSTLAVKQARLRRSAGGRATHVTYVAIDFNQQSLAEALREAGFARMQRTFFIWEGVTNYLSEQAVAATLRFVSASAPGSQLLFTYIHRGVLDGSWRADVAREIGQMLRRVGEPWTFGLDPAILADYLQTHGLRLIEDVGAAEYRSYYMKPRDGQMRGYEFYRIALAGVDRSLSANMREQTKEGMGAGAEG